MRLVVFLLYYAIAFIFGFVVRARYDAWMYSKPHMQKRLVVWAADVVTYVDAGGEDTLLPPDTADAEAFSPVAAGSRIGRLLHRGQPARADVPAPAAPERVPASRADLEIPRSDGPGPMPPPVEPA